MFYQKINLFTARTAGYHNYRIPGLLVTLNGVVLATTEARRGTGGDWDGSDILIRRSLDEGLTWEAPRQVVRQQQYGKGPVNNFVMVSDLLDGAVHALYCHNYERVFYLRSEDDGLNFSSPVEITSSLEAFRQDYPWRVIATGPGHATQLRSGRLIVPVWMSEGTGTEFGPGKLGHRPSAVSLIYSDDHGHTWQRGDIVCKHGQGNIINPSEPVMVELEDGSVLFNIRSESRENRRLEAVSPNGVSAWSAPRFIDTLLEPVCMASLIRHNWPVGDAPGQILFANPDVLEHEFSPGNVEIDRKRLTIKLSQDDAKTWPVSRILEAGPSGYSDLAVLPDGKVLCLYECGMLSHMYDPKFLTIACFDLEWLSG